MSSNAGTIKIVEVGPRDGLQNESKILPPSDRIQLIEKLVDAGLRFLEGGSFVSPKAIPQMENSEQVWEVLSGKIPEEIDLSFLVANEKGLERATKVGVKSIAVFTATSDAFTQKNINRTVMESINDFRPIVKAGKAAGMRVRGYVSTVFGCPYEGRQPIEKIVEVADALLKMGCDEISLGDTIGVAHPRQIKEVLSRLRSVLPMARLAGHFHDTRGMALMNIRAAADEGVRIFDSSVSGLGGCPYAPGSSGNVATEEVVWMLEGFGFHTGVDVEKLLTLGEWLEAKLARPMRGRLFQSKPKLLNYFEA